MKHLLLIAFIGEVFSIGSSMLQSLSIGPWSCVDGGVDGLQERR